MLPLIMPVGALLTGVALLLLGSGLLNTSLVLKSELLGYSGLVQGILMSGYFAGFLIGTFLALPLIGRIGHIRAFACCAALMAVSFCLYVLFNDPNVWIAIRILNGAALVILYTVIESWLNGHASSELRARVFALYMTTSLLSLAAAQQLLNVDPEITYVLFVLAAMCVCLSVVPVTLTKLQQPEVHSIQRIAPKTLWQAAPPAVLGALVSGLTMGAFWGLSPAYAARLGFDAGEVGIFISFSILGGALLQFPLGRFSDKRDRRVVLVGVGLGSAVVALLMIPAANVSMNWGLYALIAMFGGLAFAVYPLAVAHLVDHLEPEDMLAGGSTILLVHGVGAMIGPLIAGSLIQSVDSYGLPLYWALMQLLLAVGVFVYYRKSRKETEADHSAVFVPMMRTTPSALEMLPADESSEVDSDVVWGTGSPDTREAAAG